MSVTTLTGTNSFELKTALDRRVNDFIAEVGDMALERLDGEEASYDRMREAVESMPFLASRKMVVLRAPSANKEFAEKAETLLASIAETTDVIIYEPKLDKRTAYAKYLKKATDYTEFTELNGPELARWLTDEAKVRGGNISIIAANYLVKKVGPSQMLLASELEKLLVSSKEIDQKLIDKLVEQTPQSSIFDLLEAAFNGDYKRALSLYDEQRRQNVEPQQIIALLGWQLHILSVCAWAGDLSPGEIARSAKLNPYVVQKSLPLANRLGKGKIKRHVSALLELDEAAKTSAIQTDDALQAYLLALGQ